MKRLLIILSAAIFLVTGCSNDEQDKSKRENEDLSKKISEYETMIRIFKEVGKFNITLFEDTKTCEFIRTFKVYKIFNEYASTTTIDKKYVILTAFQSEKLILVTIINELFDNLEEGKYYEFKFSGNKNYLISAMNEELIFEHFNITSINETSKSGLEQINDNIICK